MTKYFVGAVGALLGAMGGVWLLVAPFFLVYQPQDADWADPTFVDFWTGLPLIVVSLVAFAAFAASLVAELGDRGILQRRAPAADARAAGNGQQGGATEEALAPLLAEMLRDMQEQRGREGSGTASVGGEYPPTPPANRQIDTERRTQQ